MEHKYRGRNLPADAYHQAHDHLPNQPAHVACFRLHALDFCEHHYFTPTGNRPENPAITRGAERNHCEQLFARWE